MSSPTIKIEADAEPVDHKASAVDLNASTEDLDASTVNLMASSVDPNASSVDLDASGLLVSSTFTEEVIDLLVSENHEYAKYFNFTPTKSKQNILKDIQDKQSNKRKYESESQDDDLNKNKLAKIKKEDAEQVSIKQEPGTGVVKAPVKPKPVPVQSRQENIKCWYDGTGYTCKVCRKDFYQLRFFRTHLRKTHKFSGSQLSEYLSEAIRTYDTYLYRNRFMCQICYNTRICHDKDSIKTHLRVEHQISLEEYKASHVDRIDSERYGNDSQIKMETYNPMVSYNPEVELAAYLSPTAKNINIQKEEIGNNNRNANEKPVRHDSNAAIQNKINESKTLVYSETKVIKKELNFGGSVVKKDTTSRNNSPGENTTNPHNRFMKTELDNEILRTKTTPTFGFPALQSHAPMPPPISIPNWIPQIPQSSQNILEELERKTSHHMMERTRHQLTNAWINNQ